MRSIVVFLLLVVIACAYPTVDHDAEIDFFPLEDERPLKGIENRIVGGEIAKPNQFPFQARLQLNKRSFGRIVSTLCGGSLISDKVVITAAHCLESAVSGTVHLGATRVRSPEPTHIAVSVQEKNFIIHEGWNRMAAVNDIALIRLPQSVKLNDAIQPVNLPAASQLNLDNRMGVIAGFGRIGNLPGGSNELRFVARNILPDQICKRIFFSMFKSTHVCVDGSQSKSACPGDSGGPLVIAESNGIQSLVGLTSFGSGSCELGRPTVYTRITSYLAWIHEKTGIPIRK